jgi:hypothetical protein
MSKLFSQKVIAIFFALLFSVTIFSPFIEAGSPAKNGKQANSKKARRTKSGTEILAEVMDIVSAFGGDAVATAIEEFTANLEQTTNLLQSLAEEKTIWSVNFLIANAISSLGEVARKAASENGSGQTMQSSDFGEFLENFRTTLISRCEGKSGFKPAVLAQLNTMLPHALQALTEMYKNVVDTTGFGLTFGMLSQGTTLLSFLERPEYVSQDTFKQFVNFPDEIKHQFETVIEELVSSYVDPAQFDMMLGMAKMAAQNFARRGEHEDL